jgi:hypothetical protein
MADILLCPNCGIEIEVSAVFSAQLREDLRREFEIEARQKDREIRSWKSSCAIISRSTISKRSR